MYGSSGKADSTGHDMKPEIAKSQQRLLCSHQALAIEIHRSAAQLLIDMRERLRLKTQADHESVSEIVHQTRVDSKRLRALWRMIKPGLSKLDYRALEQLSKAVAKPLGACRDAQVMQETLVSVLTGLSPETRDRLQQGLLQLLGDASVVGHAPLSEVLQSLDQLEKALSGMRLKTLHKCDVRKGLQQACKKGEELAHDALKHHAMEPMHQWRKWVKLLLFQSGWLLDEKAPNWVPKLKELGSTLGRLHDLDVLAMRIEEGRAAFWQQDLEVLNTRISVSRGATLAEIHALAEDVYAKGAGKRAKQLYRKWKH